MPSHPHSTTISFAGIQTCKSVILNSHWLRTMDNNSPKQGVYLCPKCLETYRPFSGISHNKNIGELVPAKQCLVIKVPAQHSANAPVVGGQQLASTDTEHTYHCFLMQWPETDTQYLLNTMKQSQQTCWKAGYRQTTKYSSYTAS